ncbi:MAG TPA: dihydroorotate dehydrogenase-like protein [Terracidiphilus sp.]|jgi:dihydroorotate dehydrogenase (fumarate)|nr:dihydroorotate dehydrogenase-like protein [Terracidiphilus sp.]HUX28871.1 dihydroorotate dehydrogenase-like protein [Terracidiphilus sp.]
MIDISMQYLGLKLSSPLVVSSTPLSESIDNICRMEDAGASAVVLTSLFEEQLALESRALDEDLSRGTNSFAESLNYLPDMGDYRMTQDVYLEHLRRAREAVTIPVMASLNGATTGGWIRFAKEMEQAGACAIELNTYALARTSSQTSSELELQLLDLVSSVCKSVTVPVSVKLSQSFTSIPHLASRLEAAGAAGIVIFNRFYQPDFDIEALEVRPTLHFSTPSELLPRLHWAAILFGQLHIDIGITGGVHSAEDVLKCIMAGGNIAMMASALHIHGIDHIGRVLADLRYWLEKREYASLSETRGCLSRRSASDTSPYDRGNYIKTLSSYSLRQTVAAF